MPNTLCAVPTCSGRGGHEFPKERKRCSNAWRVAIRRVKDDTGRSWWPSLSDVVCSEHFITSDYQRFGKSGVKLQRRKLKPDAVPSQFSWTKQPTSAVVSRTNRYTERCANREGTCDGNSDELSLDVDVDLDLDIAMVVNVNSEEQQIHDQAIQTDLPETLPASVSAHTQTDSGTKVQGFTIHDFKNDPKGVHYYTGLQDYLNFMDVLASLGPCAFELTYVNGKRPFLSVPD
ncbi:uncharacterized protein LOC119722625 [Patiria miniata]|uniref:THAP-type domain-containing protein n=1 Tax=Patiria miniata TaxID=46514 RepID=A0A913ZAF9_PATMI|nr:uncharacterized protein LOC119722625 [Patiria miniata]